MAALRPLLGTLLVVGCVLDGGTGRFEMTLPGADDGPPALPVVLEDRTGLVTEIGLPPIAGDFHFPDGVSNLPGRMDQLAVTWLTGARTEGTFMTFEQIDAGYRLLLKLQERPGGGILIGYGRAIAIRLAAPVDARAVQFEEVED